MAAAGDDATARVKMLLDVAGISVEGEDFEAVVRLYQRFDGSRARLASVQTGETEPMTVAVFHPGGNLNHERR